jgi:CBS domain-containing protein
VGRLLAERHVGGAPVVDSSGKVLGIVSASDLVERFTGDPDALAHRGRDVEAFPDVEGRFLEEDEEEAPFASPDTDAEETAADVMTPEVHWVPADADLSVIAAAMVKNHIHRVLVREGERYIGLISTLDVLDALAG